MFSLKSWKKCLGQFCLSFRKTFHKKWRKCISFSVRKNIKFRAMRLPQMIKTKQSIFFLFIFVFQKKTTSLPFSLSIFLMYSINICISIFSLCFFKNTSLLHIFPRAWKSNCKIPNQIPIYSQTIFVNISNNIKKPTKKIRRNTRLCLQNFHSFHNIWILLNRKSFSFLRKTFLNLTYILTNFKFWSILQIMNKFFPKSIKSFVFQKI